MFNGKMKAVTFSYDDGTTQDARLVEIFNKYGLKATFNINSGLCDTANLLYRDDVTVAHVRPRACEIAKIYEGHEVAAHTLTHPALKNCDDDEVIRQVQNDVEALSELVGYKVVGMAYPGSKTSFDDRVVDLIKNNTDIRYARTANSSYSFDLQTDLYRFVPTAHHHADFDRIFDLAKEFIELKTDTPKIFYIWGHSFEFDIHNTWQRFDDFCKLISGHDDIFYGTNREVLLRE